MTAVARAIASASAASRAAMLNSAPCGLTCCKPHALCGRDRRQRTNLVHDEILDVARRHIELAAAETLEIRKSRMRAYGNAVRRASATVARMTAGPPA